MTEARDVVPGGVVSRNVERAVWGLLLIWTGAALLLHWGWGLGLVGAGAILLGAQAYRRLAGVHVDGFALVAGSMLVVCGVWNMFDVAVQLLPLLFIAAGFALLVSIRSRRGAEGGSAGPDAHAHSHPRA